MKEEEMTPYRMRAIWNKRRMNARGYVMFWEQHVKKLPDEFALEMVRIATKIEEKVIKQCKKVHEENP